MKIKKTNILFIFLFVSLPFCVKAFGVFTHEAIVDAAWDKTIVPLLIEKYPLTTAEDLKVAHAYAYGGAVAPDMGYYPAGSKLFTDLVHYVRSGDMVHALLKHAANLNQYAFALGFLSHYYADNYGHPLATNRSVGLVYPDLGRKYGSQITYAQNKIGHVRMEFGFDVLQVARGNYASQSYRDFIGFKVDTAVLSIAFSEVYGLNINDIFSNHFQRSIETFRWVVANVLPLITKSAWAAKQSSLKEHDSTATARRFNYRMRQRNYNKDYGTGYRRPGFFPGLLSFFIRVLPKVGPLRPLKFKVPTAEAEKNFNQSFDTVLFHYTARMHQLSGAAKKLQDLNFDTGIPTENCNYILTDLAYNSLLMKLRKDNFAGLTQSLQQNILYFYKDLHTQEGKRSSDKCAVFLETLNYIKTIKPKGL